MAANTLRERILHRVDTEVAPNCMHRLPSAECLKPEGLPCPISTNMDSMIEVVRSISSEQIEPYVDRMRQRICRTCTMEDEFGNCRLRDNADCCLDNFIVLVVNIVEEEIEGQP